MKKLAKAFKNLHLNIWIPYQGFDNIYKEGLEKNWTERTDQFVKKGKGKLTAT